MQIEVLPARTGLKWVGAGFRLLRRALLPLLVITFLYPLLMVVTSALPMIGPFAPLLFIPIFSLGVMHAVRAVDRGEPPNPLMLFAGFRTGSVRILRDLLLLGLFNVVATGAALMVVSLVDDGMLLRLLTGQARAGDQTLEDQSVILAGSLFALLSMPVQLALWYAPLFVAWHEVTVTKSLFFSLLAVLRNKGAFLLLFVGWLGLAAVLSAVVQIVSRLFGVSPQMMPVVMSPLSLIMVAAMYCSYWLTYKDAVRVTEGPPGTLDDAPGG